MPCRVEFSIRNQQLIFTFSLVILAMMLGLVDPELDTRVQAPAFGRFSGRRGSEEEAEREERMKTKDLVFAENRQTLFCRF
jgi:hypothetical protein